MRISRRTITRFREFGGCGTLLRCESRHGERGSWQDWLTPLPPSSAWRLSSRWVLGRRLRMRTFGAGTTRARVGMTRTRVGTTRTRVGTTRTWVGTTRTLVGTTRTRIRMRTFCNRRSCAPRSGVRERVSPSLAGTGAALAFAWSGLRRVDARTGGPVSIRSVLIGLVLDLARQSATRPLFRARARREQDRRKELAPRLKEIERDQVADPEARRRAVRAFYKENNFNPFAGCGWQLAGPILSQLVLAGAIRDGRTVHDRLTGTIVVTDR